MKLPEIDKATGEGGFAGAAQSWASGAFDSMRLPRYRTLWAANVFGFMAFYIALTVQSVVAYDLTGANAAVGTVMVGQGLALFFILPLGGAIADQFSKRRLMMLAQSAFCICALVIGLLISLGEISILWLTVSTFITGCMLSINSPARTAMVGEIVSRDRVGNGVALIQIGHDIGRISGPLIAAILLTIGFIGSSGTYFLVAAVLAMMIYILSSLPRDASRGGPLDLSVTSDVIAAIRYILSRPRLRHIVLGTYLLTIVGYAHQVVLPGMAKDVLGGGDGGLGVLMSAAAVGGFFMSIVIASLADSRHAEVLLIVFGLLTGVSLIFTGFAPTLVVASATMFFVTGGSTAFQTLSFSLVLRLSDPMFYGRMGSIFAMSVGVSNVSSLLVGIAADEFGERAMLWVTGAALCLIIVGLAMTRPSAGEQSLAAEAT